MAPKESSRPSHRHSRRREESARRNEHRSKKRSHARRPATSSDDTTADSSRGSHALSAGALARLEREKARESARAKQEPRRQKRERTHDRRGVYEEAPQMLERTRDRDKRHQTEKRKKKRVVSGAIMEEGRAKPALRGGSRPESYDSYDKDYRQLKPKRRKNKKLWIIGAVSVLLLIIVIIVAVVVSQKNKGGEGDSGSDSDNSDASNLDGKDRNSIPAKWRSTFLDPWSWATTDDFNVTFTESMVGDLPVMGLFSEWDDSARANDQVPPLNKPWGSYEDKPARGVNLGGWLVLEPFITPSLFEPFEGEGTNDEWVLCQQLSHAAPETMEKHYASFVTEDTLRDIRDAGLDHVRIPFGYWAVAVYDGDPFIFRTSWRYLLRAIEWARKYGLRVNLDLHGLPGSQNGWNHSGRWGHLGWFNGTDGALNAQRSSDIHDQLSKFFAQDRYKNIITHYGVGNEPRMTYLDTNDVIGWTEGVYKTVRDNGMDALVVFGDGFMGLDNWQGLMMGYDDMVLDVHQYVIFNRQQIDFTHRKKVEYACKGWTEQAELSMDRTRGYGPTLFAEWSQADTDCAKYLTGVGAGSRWEGTYSSEDGTASVLAPGCPTKDEKCSCREANADPGDYSAEYKRFLKMFAEAQMHSFEVGLGWWYWTWKTESSPGSAQWSYETGVKAGILPQKAYEREFNCDSDVPDFESEGLPEWY